MQHGRPADWAWDSFQIARDAIYSEFKPGPTTGSNGVALPQDHSTNIVRQQLQRAGARLAFLLSAMFGPLSRVPHALDLCTLPLTAAATLGPDAARAPLGRSMPSSSQGQCSAPAAVFETAHRVTFTVRKH